MRQKSQKILTKIASVILVISMTIPAIGSVFQYALGAGSYSSLGTNKALGSPILNENFSADDWNKWEMIVWGLFLSNFTTPFIDDYNSAFNLDAGYGSNGSGSKALKFASGTDVANTKSLQDLLDYASNQQSTGAVKTLYVSYNKLENGEITSTASFSGASTGNQTPPDPDTDDPDNADPDEADPDGTPAGTGNIDSSIREATVKDLFFNPSNSGVDTTWAEVDAANGFTVDKFVNTKNYIPLVGIDNASVPTFAVKTSSGTYETVYDYTDSYDLSVTNLVLTRGLCGDYSKEFAEVFEKIWANPENYKVVLDCFGNICTLYDNTYRVIIPAAANKHLTSNPSINLVNSLIFNACTNTSSQEQLILNAGQTRNNWWLQWAGNDIRSGVAAFANKTDGLNPGQAVLFFDTDTIVMQDAIKAGKRDDYTVNVGELYKKLYSLDIDSLLTGGYTFKIEPANLSDSVFNVFSNGDSPKEACQNMILASSQLSNIFNTVPDAKVLTELKTDTGTLNIFGDPVVIPVQLPEGTQVYEGWPITGWFASDKKYNAGAIHRMFGNWVYQLYNQDFTSTAGDVKSADVRAAFDNAESAGDLFGNLIKENSTSYKLSNLTKSFIQRRTEFYTVKDLDKLKALSYSPAPVAIPPMVLEGGQISDTSAFSADKVDMTFGSVMSAVMDHGNSTSVSEFSRSVKAYSTSETMRSIANILGVRDGTEFAVYSMYIYLTYLDWYGITGSSLSSLNGVGNTSNLNPRIFDENSDVLKVDITSITEVMTDEQKEKQILNWTYLMLNPTDGRQYRSQLIISGISDWIYDNYQKIVYGNASSYYDTGTGVTSRNSTGFMTVSPYSENFMTAWFVNNYAYFSVIMIGLFFILTIIIGILKKRKASWFLVSIFAMVNMILILPATGDIVPLMSNNFVQNMFSDKMSYWAISESVTNATMESDYVSGNTISNTFMGRISKDEQAQIINMVKNLNTLYLDRSLCVKQDISKKVNQTDTSTFEDVQQLRSARWMLPMIMRQFTAQDGSANYVYVPLGDLYDDLSNMYWYYKPEDADFVKTVNSQQATSADGSPLPVYQSSNNSGPHNASNRVSYFLPYNNHSSGYDPSSYAYKQKSYEESVDNNVHTYSYFIITNGLIQTNIPNYSSYNSYDEWAKAYANQLMQLNTISLDETRRSIEQVGGKYSRFDRGTIREIYSYLWATENPFHYFYEGIKDSFPYDSSLGSIVGELQGTYVENQDLGKEVRKTFMHANETGYVRDILDLEEMFKNMIPYLYTIQLYAEGYDGVGGTFDDGDLIENYKIYKGNNKSWLFRSNWVTKMMENKDFHKSAIIRLADGSKATVANMMLPSCYEEAGRPMVFSEAQMHMLGLDLADLSLIELKCVQINKDVSQKWTLMLNYASVPGMTKEVMIRQMALDALITFNEEFTPAGILNGSYSMYPSGIDLRSISFDSVMKMLMLNVTHDTSYIYGDTMQTMVEDSDIFTAFLLLATAFICAFLIPLARNIVMGLIFFLGLWALLWSIFRSTKTKAKVSCGYIVSNFVFLAMTFVYYLAFRAIMAMTATDEVLSLSQIEINTGNPVWCLIFVLIVSLLYCFGIYKMIQFCVKNYRDMGFEVYAGIAEMAAGGISSKIEQLGAKLSGDDTSSSSSSRGNKKKEPVDVRTSEDSQIGEMDTQEKKDRKQSPSDTTDSRDDYDSSAYTDGRCTDDSHGSADIDREIERGKELADKEKDSEKKTKDREINRETE